MRSIDAKRIVIKVGTNTICKTDGTLDFPYVEDMARQISELHRKGIETIIVTSGAIGSGSAELKLGTRQKDIAEKQACAAVGQTTVMLAYRDAFQKHNRSVGQVLLTYGAFSARKRYLNLRKTIDKLFEIDVIPIINENDVISTDEIEDVFGDNDKLSAMVASKIDADLLIMLTDVDGLYDRNPRTDDDARLLTTIDEITKDIEKIAGTRRNMRAVGGMRTKIAAAKITMQSGCHMIIANGRLENVILRIAGGEEIGTHFTPKERYSNRERWIIFASPKGKILVDSGAEKALKDGKSLLALGIEGVEGRFKEGDVIRIGAFAKGISNHSSSEIMDIRTTALNERKSGIQNRDNNRVIVDNENIVILE